MLGIICALSSQSLCFTSDFRTAVGKFAFSLAGLQVDIVVKEHGNWNTTPTDLEHSL